MRWIWAVAYKELRQLIGMAIIAVVLVYLFLKQLQDAIPFTDDMTIYYIPLLAGGLALVAGFWQTLSEHQRGTWLFLLHRPVSRVQINLVKMGTGLLLVLLAVGIPMLVQMLWLAQPGNLPAPFHWEMTLPFWKNLLVMTPLYLAAYLAGLRKANWLGTRTFPVLLGLLFSTLLLSVPVSLFVFGALVVANLLYLTAILQQCQLEEYA